MANENDTSFIGLTKAIRDIGEAFTEFKTVNDERLKAIDGKQDGKATELAEKLAKIEKSLSDATAEKKRIETEMALLRERTEDLEARAKSPGKTYQDKQKDEHLKTFVGWIRNKGQSASHEQQLQQIQQKLMEQKDVSIGSSAGGGYAVPEIISREIERLERKFSPVRDLVKVVQAGSSDYKELVNIRGMASGWVGETPSPPRSVTGTSQLREVVPTFGELYAYPQASEWSLDDIFFNVEAWLAEEAAQEFAYQEGVAVISGNGSSKPTGMINSTPTTAADFASPLRGAAVYQYIADASGVSPSVPQIHGDKLIDLIYTLNSAYRSGASFVMNSVTTGAVRKLKDTMGQYLWQPGLAAGQPNSLLGFPLATWEQMDDIGTNKFPIAFGNFRRGYVLADRVGLRITRDNVTNVGFVRFYIRRREGGIVLNNDSIKWLRTTA